MLLRTLKNARNFLLDKSGNVVVPFALAAIPVVGLMGASMDYSRAANVRTQLQGALDAAVLSAAHKRQATDAQIESHIRTHIDAMMGGEYGSSQLSLSVVRGQNDNLIEVDATLNVDTTLLGVMGIDNMTVGADAAVSAEYRALEVALVLDNTGSMARRMSTLRAAAQDFVDVVTEEGANDLTSIALVPYVASVNIGAGMSGIVDQAGQSRHHASLLETRWLGKYDSCSYPNWGNGDSHEPDPDNSSDDTSSLTGPAWQVPGFHLADYASVYTEAFHKLFGIQAAFADDPYTYGVHDGCYITNPEEISHWQLFEQIDVDWKGCVEARPEPFDVTDEPPVSTNPDTLWVPYFWMDDSDRFRNWVPRGNNEWIADAPFLNSTDMNTNYWGRTHSVLKYTTANTMRIDETPPSTRGPNMSCGDPILPLTNNYSTLSQRVGQMSHWYNGGTQTAQGVAWGWRALSPTPPFTEGAPYDEANKVMVIMTDGENWLVSSDNEAVLSDYSAYGHLRWGRYPGETTNDARQYIDERTLTTCTNAKAAGVVIYTVTFGLRNATTRALWDDCATETTMAYHVDTSNELIGAFNDIADSVGELRLTQ